MPSSIAAKPWLVEFGVVIWVSFLAAAVATMLFFATFDPLDLAEIATFPLQLSRMAIYSIGFILFWLLLAGNGAIIVWLLDHRPVSEKEGEH